MIDETFAFVAAVFFLAGFVKGVIGLGLPTVSMGLLAVALTTVEAAAILLLPSFLTNVWQMLAGPSLRSTARRLCPMMLGVCLGTWAGSGLMATVHARFGAGLLGTALALYAVSGLFSLRVAIQQPRERWLGPLVGGVTGLITAATGVFIIPAVPYLQAIGLEKEQLVQALGLSFTVSTCALAVNLTLAGTFNASVAGMTVGALGAACIGMWVGQRLRLRLRPATFQRWFFVGLLSLGIYLIARSAV